MRIDAMGAGDKNLVLNSWTKSWTTSYRLASKGRMPMPTDDACAMVRSRIDRILERPGAIVLVARDDANPVFIYGWACAERFATTFVMHFVFVKSHFRHGEDGNHYGRALLRACADRCATGADRLVATHRTYVDAKATELGFEYVPVERLYRQEAA